MFSEMDGHMARMGKRGEVGKPEGRRPLGRHKRKWEDNIKTDIQEIGSRCVDCIDLAQDGDRWRALIKAVKVLRVL
jgi:hypothetical protein